MDAIGPEDAEFAFVVTTKIDETASTLAGASQRYLVNRSDALPVLVLKQHNGLARHRRG